MNLEKDSVLVQDKMNYTSLGQVSLTVLICTFVVCMFQRKKRRGIVITWASACKNFKVMKDEH